MKVVKPRVGGKSRGARVFQMGPDGKAEARQSTRAALPALGKPSAEKKDTCRCSVEPRRPFLNIEKGPSSRRGCAMMSSSPSTPSVPLAALMLSLSLVLSH